MANLLILLFVAAVALVVISLALKAVWAVLRAAGRILVILGHPRQGTLATPVAFIIGLLIILGLFLQIVSALVN
jgi:hypothetical protein